MGLENVFVNGDKIEGNMVVLPDVLGNHLDPPTDEPNIVNKKSKPAVLLEVHLYTDSTSEQESRLSLPVSSITRLDVYTFDEKATKKSRIYSTVGIAVSAAFIIGFISLAGIASMTF